MKFRDISEVLAAVETARKAQPVTEEEIVRPEGVPARHLEVPCGVVYPCFVPVIAELLGIAPADVDKVMTWEANLKRGSAGTPDYRVEPREPGLTHHECGVEAIAAALGSLPDSHLLRQLKVEGISPLDLIVRCCLVPAGCNRHNSPSANGNPICSALNAAWLHLHRQVKRLEWGGLPFLAAQQALSVQRAFLYLLDRMAGRPLQFSPLEEVPTGRPASPEMVIAPPRFSEVAEPPRGLLQTAFVADGVLIHTSNALIHITLPEPSTEGAARFSLHRLGACRMSAVSSDGLRVLFLSGVSPRASVYDVLTHSFVKSLDRLPDIVVVGACCTIDLLNLSDFTGCCLPGPPLSSPVDCVTTPCADYVWLCLTPPSDDIGIVSLRNGEAVFQPWPHPALEGITFNDDTDYDSASRALTKMPDGCFRFLWDRFLFTGSVLSMEIEEAYSVAAFDQTGSRLILGRDDSFHILYLNDGGALIKRQGWDLTPVHNHLTWGLIRTPAMARFTEEEVMRAVGTVESLAESDPAEVLTDFETTLRYRDIGGAEAYEAVRLSQAEAANLISRAHAAKLTDEVHPLHA